MESLRPKNPGERHETPFQIDAVYKEPGQDMIDIMKRELAKKRSTPGRSVKPEDISDEEASQAIYKERKIGLRENA